MSSNSLIQTILNDKMNSICFDCSSNNISFVSINNGIFLCNECATVHMSFPQEVSIIENSDLYSLTELALKYLAYGGNTRLNDFILDEFPKLENYSQKLLYKTRAMEYYRKRLYYYVNGGPEPRRPSQIVGCQLIPQNQYNKNYVQIPSKKYEPKTRTYKPPQAESRKFNINKRNNNENDNDDEDVFMKDPFREERNYGLGGNMFKKFFGNDFFGDDDDFFNFGNKLNKTQIFDEYPSYNNNTYNYQPQPPQRKPINLYKSTINNNINNIKDRNEGPKDNLSRSMYPANIYSKNINNINKRPQTAKNAIFVPSRKHKYIKKENQNLNNNENSNRKYNPFERRDSTDLIIVPGTKKEKENIKQKTKEIPLEFHKQATGLGQLADTINENDEDLMSDGSNSEEELDKIAKEREQREEKEKEEKYKNKFYDGSEATFQNSIRNKYKKKKTEELEKKIQNYKNEDKLKSIPKNNNFNNNINNSGKSSDNNKRRNNNTNNEKENKDNNRHFNMKSYARRLSKIHLSSTNWNINQLGDILTYPDVMEIEE